MYVQLKSASDSAYPVRQKELSDTLMRSPVFEMLEFMTVVSLVIEAYKADVFAVSQISIQNVCSPKTNEFKVG